MAGLLEPTATSARDADADADVVVVNTCSVRERAEDKLYTRLGEIREATAGARRRARSSPSPAAWRSRKGEALFAAARGHRRRRRHAEPQAAAGARRRRRAVAARAAIDIHPHDDVSFPLGVARHVGSGARVGHDHRRLQRVLRVLRRAVHARARADAAGRRHPRGGARGGATGRREVQLLGQIVNHYQAPDDAACDFAGLLERVSAVPGIARMRFASPHPRHVTDAADRRDSRPPEGLQAPAPAGAVGLESRCSRRCAGATRARSTSSSSIALRAAVPGIALSTDMIVGFPGETAEDFDLTLDLVRRVRFHSMYSFKYSPRPNTLAIKRLADDVPEAEKTRADSGAAGAAARHSGRVASRQRSARSTTCSSTRRRAAAAWELAGRTSGNTVVNFPGPQDWLGRLVPRADHGRGAEQPARRACRAAAGRREPAVMSCRTEGAHAD